MTCRMAMKSHPAHSEAITMSESSVIIGIDKDRWEECEPHDMSHYDNLVGLPFPSAPVGASKEYMDAQSELSTLFRKVQEMPMNPNTRLFILDKIVAMGLKDVNADISVLLAGNKWLSDTLNNSLAVS